MVTVERYIRDYISFEMSARRLYGEDFVAGEVIRYVAEGIYAFQLIWGEDSGVFLVKPLDHALVRSCETPFGIMFSYDGTRNAKYSEDETLVLPIDVIRDIKIDSIDG